jgi:hypothetical protein
MNPNSDKKSIQSKQLQLHPIVIDQRFRLIRNPNPFPIMLINLKFIDHK